MYCDHNNDAIINRVWLFITMVLLFFVIREICAWFSKGNYIISIVKETNQKLTTIDTMLRGFSD